MTSVDTILTLYKYFGETPLECINRYKDAHPEYRDIPMTYAGRLDPLAEGVLIVLAGDSVYNKEDFLKLPKKYRVEALIGVSTDSYDMLGIPTAISDDISVSLEQCKRVIENFVHITELPYPPFSSRTVDGVPLFTLAKEGKLPDVLPKRSVSIYDARLNDVKTVSRADVYARLDESLKVTGDFRQDSVRKAWEGIRGTLPENLTLVDFSVSCGSGVYMRTLSRMLGELLGSKSLAYSIVRESVGMYEIKK